MDGAVLVGVSGRGRGCPGWRVCGRSCPAWRDGGRSCPDWIKNGRGRAVLVGVGLAGGRSCPDRLRANDTLLFCFGSHSCFVVCDYGNDGDRSLVV